MMIEAPEPAHPSHLMIEVMGVDNEMGSTGKRGYCQNANQRASAAAAASCEDSRSLNFKRLRVAYEECKPPGVVLPPAPTTYTPFPELPPMSMTVVLDECCTPTRKRPSAELPPFFLTPSSSSFLETVLAPPSFHDDHDSTVPLPAKQDDDTTWIDYLLLQFGSAVHDEEGRDFTEWGVVSEEDDPLSPSLGAAKSYWYDEEDVFFFLQESGQSPHRRHRENTFNSTPTALLPPGCFVPILLPSSSNMRIDSGTNLISACGSTGITNNNQKNNLKEGDEEEEASAGVAAAEAAASMSSSGGLLKCKLLLDERDAGDACPLSPRAVTPCRGSIRRRVAEQQSTTPTTLDPLPPVLTPPCPAKPEADLKDPTLVTLTSFPFRILFVNEAFVALTGRNDLVGRSFFDTFDRGGAPPPSLAKSPDTLLNVFDIKDVVQVVAAKNKKINNNNTQHYCVNSSRKKRVLAGTDDDGDDTTSRTMMNPISCLIDVKGVESSSGELCNFAVKLSPLPPFSRTRFKTTTVRARSS